MDGQHPLPDQDPRKGQNRDEPAGAGLQYEATDQYLRRQPADAGDRGLTAPARWRELPLSRNTASEVMFSHDLGRKPTCSPTVCGAYSMWNDIKHEMTTNPCGDGQ